MRVQHLDSNYKRNQNFGINLKIRTRQDEALLPEEYISERSGVAAQKFLDQSQQATKNFKKLQRLLAPMKPVNATVVAEQLDIEPTGTLSFSVVTRNGDFDTNKIVSIAEASDNTLAQRAKDIASCFNINFIKRILELLE